MKAAAARQSGIELVLESTDAAGWTQRISAWDSETSINYVYQYNDPTLGGEGRPLAFPHPLTPMSVRRRCSSIAYRSVIPAT
jgi:hypothetical protein